MQDKIKIKIADLGNACWVVRQAPCYEQGRSSGARPDRVDSPQAAFQGRAQDSTSPPPSQQDWAHGWG